MTETESDSAERDGDPTAFLDGWPPSNYPIAAAVLLLVATGVTLVVSTEEAANRLATYAYYFLVLGVALRLVEHAAGERLQGLYRRATARLSAALDEAVTRASQHHPPRRNRAKPRRGFESMHRVRERLDGWRTEARARGFDEVLLTTALAVFLTGLVLLVVWWQQPWTFPSGAYVAGWLLVVAALGSVYVAVR